MKRDGVFLFYMQQFLELYIEHWIHQLEVMFLLLKHFYADCEYRLPTDDMVKSQKHDEGEGRIDLQLWKCRFKLFLLEGQGRQGHNT